MSHWVAWGLLPRNGEEGQSYGFLQGRSCGHLKGWSVLQRERGEEPKLRGSGVFRRIVWLRRAWEKDRASLKRTDCEFMLTSSSPARPPTAEAIQFTFPMPVWINMACGTIGFILCNEFLSWYCMCFYLFIFINCLVYLLSWDSSFLLSCPSLQ